MYAINKLVFVFLNPVAITLLLLLAALAAVAFCGAGPSKRSKRAAIALLALAFAFLAFFSTPFSQLLIGLPLERDFPPQAAEDAPCADAIVVLGGGIAATPESMPYPELLSGADRVVHAARLFKAGKAPLIIPSGAGEAQATIPFLLDLGIPRDAIVAENASRNTEENALFVQKFLGTRAGADSKIKVLLVTSAWHMRRSILMFKRYAPDIEIIPCATDHETTLIDRRELSFFELFPNAASLDINSYLIKEYIGYWGYKFLR